MSPTQTVHNTFSAGVQRLMPVFLPRRFSAPGRRLRLYPDDYFAFGTNRGAIKEHPLQLEFPAESAALVAMTALATGWTAFLDPDRSQASRTRRKRPCGEVT